MKLGCTSVAEPCKDWDFYEWNTVKHQYPRSTDSSTNAACCAIA
jgi:hypothetical protein